MTTADKLMLSELHAQAIGVADRHSKFEEARMELRKARVEILETLVASVRPALPAISDRVPIQRTETHEGTTSEHAPWVGLRVNGSGPVLKAGAFGGRDLFLRPDGTFVALVYSGENDGKGYARWTAMAWDIEPARVVKEWDLSTLCDVLRDALAREAGGGRGKRTAQTVELAERLRALGCILRSWGL